MLPNSILDIKEELVNSIHSEYSLFGLTVFPNPTKSVIQLNANFKSNIDKLSLEVFGDTGQVVYRSSFSQVVSPWHYNLDLTRLQLIPGQYVVRLSDGTSGEEKKIILIE